ncbi:SLC13 family permease, partial [Pseudoalteromonas aliena]
AVTPQQIIQKDDVMLLLGDIKSVPLLTRFDGIKVVHENHQKDIEHLVEVLVSQSSKYIGNSVKEASFREQ